jgi:hypothetical protein
MLIAKRLDLFIITELQPCAHHQLIHNPFSALHTLRKVNMEICNSRPHTSVVWSHAYTQRRWSAEPPRHSVQPPGRCSQLVSTSATPKRHRSGAIALTEACELLERGRRQFDVVVAAAVASVDDPNGDGLACVRHSGRLAACLAVARVTICDELSVSICGRR